eukprot:TRINITY_DN110589_c0_g1_i1.p1 TRINITY_DN110589_c0_g1~~TRINITY_DN110589_c0_g1_i1.p1  ORF type:complete len:368 (-),score=55.21 TRINITY_DN110589_c0_g1_i1:181-1284(-)
MAQQEHLTALSKMALSASLGAFLAAQMLGNQVAKRKVAADASSSSSTSRLDCRRQWALVTGGATDHAGEVVIVPGDGDLSRTIFANLKGPAKLVMSATVSIELHWSDAAVQRITTAYATVPRAPDVSKGILDFMENECDFLCEHADGSFMDHLQFCYKYSSAHYKHYSPRVLFLHSILGVGTNVFPMKVDKEPKLRELLTEFEFKHVEAFPSILRLLYIRTFIDELTKNLPRIDKLERVTFHRVVDNKELSLTAEELWVHLNYQICHQLDFLPAGNWGALQGNTFLAIFCHLYDFLVASKKLVAEVNFDWSSREATGSGLPLTLGGLVMQYVPKEVTRTVAAKQMRQYSQAIGHSLDYSLHWLDSKL